MNKNNHIKLISLLLSLSMTTSLASCKNTKIDISNELTINDVLDKTSDLTNIDDIASTLVIDRTNNNGKISLSEAINEYKKARVENDKFLCNTYLAYIGKILLCSYVMDKLNINEEDLISFDFGYISCRIKYYETVTSTVSGNITITDRVERDRKINFATGFANEIADAAYTAYCHNYGENKDFDNLYKKYIMLLAMSESNKTKDNDNKLKLVLDEEKMNRIK